MCDVIDGWPLLVEVIVYLTKQPLTSFLKKGRWTNFSSLNLDKRIGSRSSWVSMYFWVCLEGDLWKRSVSEAEPELDPLRLLFELLELL